MKEHEKFALSVLIPLMHNGKMKTEDAVATLREHHAAHLITLLRANVLETDIYNRFVFTPERWAQEKEKERIREERKRLKKEIALLQERLESLKQTFVFYNKDNRKREDCAKYQVVNMATDKNITIKQLAADICINHNSHDYIDYTNKTEGAQAPLLILRKVGPARLT